MSESKIITGVVGDANWLALMARVETVGFLLDEHTQGTLEFTTVDDYLCATDYDADDLEQQRLDTPDDENLFSVKCEGDERAHKWLALVRQANHDEALDDPNRERFDDVSYAIIADTYMEVGGRRLFLVGAGRTQPMTGSPTASDRFIVTIHDGAYWDARGGEVIVFVDKEAHEEAEEAFIGQTDHMTPPDETKVKARIPVKELLAAWVKLNPGQL